MKEQDFETKLLREGPLSKESFGQAKGCVGSLEVLLQAGLGQRQAGKFRLQLPSALEVCTGGFEVLVQSMQLRALDIEVRCGGSKMDLFRGAGDAFVQVSVWQYGSCGKAQEEEGAYARGHMETIHHGLRTAKGIRSPVKSVPWVRRP